MWYQANSTTFTAHDHDTIGGDFIVPGTTFTLHDFGAITGAMMVKSMTIHDNDNIFLDTSVAGTNGSVALVK